LFGKLKFLRTDTNKPQSIKENASSLDFIKIKNFSLNDTVIKAKRQVKDWEKIFAKHISDKGLIPRMYE
jgi:hypothetical protein